MSNKEKKQIISKPKDVGGRPMIVLTPEQIVEVRALSQYLSQQQMADYLEISRDTFSEILKRQPEVFRQYNKGRADAILDITKGTLQKAREGDFNSIRLYLTTQAGWNEKQYVNLMSEDGSMSPHKTIKDLSTDELKEIVLKELGIAL